MSDPYEPTELLGEVLEAAVLVAACWQHVRELPAPGGLLVMDVTPDPLVDTIDGLIAAVGKAYDRYLGTIGVEPDGLDGLAATIATRPRSTTGGDEYPYRPLSPNVCPACGAYVANGADPAVMSQHDCEGEEG